MLHIVEHPCIKAKLTILRDRGTPCPRFRRCVQEITGFIACEALRKLELEEFRVETPLAETAGWRLRDELVLVPILRAGMGMLDALLELAPEAKVGFIGLERDHAGKLPREYYCKLPEPGEHSLAVLIDPMLASGNSLAGAIELLKSNGFRRILVITILSAPEGKAVIESRYPEIEVYTGSLDERLDENKYIVPGLGDAGDRIFGTIAP